MDQWHFCICNDVELHRKDPDLVTDVDKYWSEALELSKSGSRDALACFNEVAFEAGLDIRLLEAADVRPESGTTFTPDQIALIRKYYGFHSFGKARKTTRKCLLYCTHTAAIAGGREPHCYTAFASDDYAAACLHLRYLVSDYTWGLGMQLRRARRRSTHTSGSAPTIVIDAKARAAGVTTEMIEAGVRAGRVLGERRARDVLEDLAELDPEDWADYYRRLEETLEEHKRKHARAAPMDVEEPAAAPAPAPSRAERGAAPAPAAARPKRCAADADAPPPPAPAPKRRAAAKKASAPAPAPAPKRRTPPADAPAKKKRAPRAR